MRLSARDIKDLNLIKHYRIIRKWACKNNELNDADLELLIYLDCIGFFSKKDFIAGVYSYSWDNRRWNRLLKEGWIVKWRGYNGADKSYSIYQVSLQTKNIIQQIYRIMLGTEDIPTSTRRNPVMKRISYSDKTLATAIEKINKDKTR